MPPDPIISPSDGESCQIKSTGYTESINSCIRRGIQLLKSELFALSAIRKSTQGLQSCGTVSGEPMKQLAHSPRKHCQQTSRKR